MREQIPIIALLLKTQCQLSSAITLQLWYSLQQYFMLLLQWHTALYRGMKYVDALFQVETRTHHEPEINCRISTPLIDENVYSQRNSLWYALSHSSSKGKTSSWIMQHTKIQSYSTQKITPNSFLCMSLKVCSKIFCSHRINKSGGFIEHIRSIAI